MTSMNIYSKEQIDAKAAAILPATTGATAGQVLGLDANLEPAWINGGAPAPILKNLTNAQITLSYKTSFGSGYYTGILDSTSVITGTYDVGGYRITSRLPQIYNYGTNTSMGNCYDAGNSTNQQAIKTWLDTNLNQIEDGKYQIVFSPQVAKGQGYVLPWKYTVNNGVFTREGTIISNNAFLDNPVIVAIYKIN